MSIKKSILAAAFAAAAAASPAYAVDFGDTLTCSSNTNVMCTQSTATVSNGIEFQITNGSQVTKTADFSLTQLTFTSLNDGSLGSTIFSFSDLTHPFTSASLTSNMGWTGLDASDIALDGGVLTLNLGGTAYSANSYFTVALSSGASALPEVTTWAMMILGMGVVGYAMRRRQEAAKAAFQTA